MNSVVQKSNGLRKEKLKNMLFWNDFKLFTKKIFPKMFLYSTRENWCENFQYNRFAPSINNIYKYAYTDAAKIE